jgi:hypothetical protein
MISKTIYKVPAGKLLRVTIEHEGDILLAAQIHGDFFLHPEEVITALERAITSSPLNQEELRSRLQEALDAHDAQMVGADANTIAHAILIAAGKVTS